MFSVLSFTQSNNLKEHPFIDDFKIINYESHHDTLVLLAKNELSYFPFGRYNDFLDFLKAYPLFIVSKTIIHSYNDLETDTLYNFSYKGSRIEFFQDPEDKLLKIVSGAILDSNVVFKNGLKIGNSKSSICKMLITSIPTDIKSINVIEVVSVLTGIWHYYNFKNELLMNIKFVTDYQFNK